MDFARENPPREVPFGRVTSGPRCGSAGSAATLPPHQSEIPKGHQQGNLFPSSPFSPTAHLWRLYRNPQALLLVGLEPFRLRAMDPSCIPVPGGHFEIRKLGECFFTRFINRTWSKKAPTSENIRGGTSSPPEELGRAPVAKVLQG